MKLAYIGYDLNCLKAQTALTRHFSEITFFLIEQREVVPALAFENIPVFADGIMIPRENELRTPKHLAIRKKIKKQYEEFKNELFGELKTKKSELANGTSKASFQVESLSDVGDVFFDSKKAKVYIERKNRGTEEFDFMLIENHQMIAERLRDFKNSPLSGTTMNSHVWFSVQFNFELKSPREGVAVPHNLLLINNSDSESIIDNWYFCQLDKGLATIQQWVPFNQHANRDYQKFIIARTRAVIEQQLDYIQLRDQKDQYVDSTSGFCFKKASLANAKLSAEAPSFAFWSTDKIDSFVTVAVDAKIRKMIKLENTRGEF